MSPNLKKLGTILAVAGAINASNIPAQADSITNNVIDGVEHLLDAKSSFQSKKDELHKTTKEATIALKQEKIKESLGERAEQLKKEALEQNGHIIFYKIEELKNEGFSSSQITDILLIAALSENGQTAFYSTYIDDMINIGLNNNQIFQILKNAASCKNGYILFDNGFIIKLKEKGGLTNNQITDILKRAVSTKHGEDIFRYIDNIKDGGLNSSDLITLFKEVTKIDLGYLIFNKIGELINKLGLNGEDIADILGDFLGENNLGFKENFANSYSPTKVIRKNIFLGKKFKEYEVFFDNKESFKIFVEQILIKTSTHISSSINDVYDYYEEPGRSYPYGNKKNKPGSKTIIGQIKQKLKEYSTEELFSSLGNHPINYSTTFGLILMELDLRISSSGNKDYFDFIDSNTDLTNTTKIFLKGQIIAGLSARGKTNKLNKLLKDTNNFSIIDKIIDYKNNSIFNINTYLGLVIGIKDIIEINKELQRYIFINYYNNNQNPKFNRALDIAFGLKNKKMTETGIVELTDEEKEDMKEIKKLFLLDNKRIFSKKVKDVTIIYGGDTEGGGLQYYKKDINEFINDLGYKIEKKGKGFFILEKDGIRSTFINYDEIYSIPKLLKENGISIIASVYRGHNYKTSTMIENSDDILKKADKSFLIDGGCRNMSALTRYRKKGIKNMLIAYTDVGKGDATNQLLKIFISKYLRNETHYGNREMTISEVFNEILPSGSYAKNFMKFPGDLMDIVWKVENGVIASKGEKIQGNDTYENEAITLNY